MPGRRRDTRDATASDRPAKNAKLNNAFSPTQPIVEVILESSKTSDSFKIHEDLLRSHSLYFRDYLESLEEPKPLVLRDVSSETFETFSRWIYTKILVVDELEDEDCDTSDTSDTSDDNGRDDSGNGSNDAGSGRGNLPAQQRDVNRNGVSGSKSHRIPNNNGDYSEHPPSYSSLNRKGRVFIRLTNLYKFATSFQASSFKNAIMIQWQRFIINNETLPCPTVVKHALSGLSIKSCLCQYLITCYAHYTDYKEIEKARFATLSPEFLTEVLALVFNRFEIMEINEHWCEFHEHKDEEEREECEKSREKDPDVVAKRMYSRHVVCRLGHRC